MVLGLCLVYQWALFVLKPLTGFRATNADHLRLTGNIVGNFLFVLTELFALGAFVLTQSTCLTDRWTGGQLAHGQTGYITCSMVKTAHNEQTCCSLQCIICTVPVHNGSKLQVILCVSITRSTTSQPVKRLIAAVLEHSSITNSQSHAGTVVPECFKDDNASQWKSGKFDPRSLKNPRTDRHLNLHG